MLPLRCNIGIAIALACPPRGGVTVIKYAANQMHVMVSLVNQSVRSSTCDSYARLMMFLQRQSFISWLRTVP